MGKYFPDTARHAKAQEFLELKQGTMTVMEYVARFTELARFADDYVATDMAKVRRFENELKLSIRGKIVGFRLPDIDSMVGIALTIEREIEDARSTRDAGVSSKRKESQSSSNSRKKQKASNSRGSKAAAIRAKDGSELPVRLGRWCATIASSPNISGGIAPLGFRDSTVLVSGGTGLDTVYFSTAQYRPGEQYQFQGATRSPSVT